MFAMFLEILMHFVLFGTAVLLFVLFAKVRIFYRAHDFMHKNNAKFDAEVQAILVALRARTKADRVYVCRFHNGSEYLYNDPVWKVTRSYEDVRKGVTSESDNNTGVYVSRMPEMMESLMTGKFDCNGIFPPNSCANCQNNPNCHRIDKYCQIIQVDDLDAGYTKSHLVAQNVNTTIRIGLAGEKGVFGLIGIDICGAAVTDIPELDRLSAEICPVADELSYMFLKKK